MNDMNHVIECDFEGAKTLKLSGKKQQFWQIFAIFWGKPEKSTKFGRGQLFFKI